MNINNSSKIQKLTDVASVLSISPIQKQTLVKHIIKGKIIETFIPSRRIRFKSPFMIINTNYHETKKSYRNVTLMSLSGKDTSDLYSDVYDITIFCIKSILYSKKGHIIRARETHLLNQYIKDFGLQSGDSTCDSRFVWNLNSNDNINIWSSNGTKITSNIIEDFNKYLVKAIIEVSSITFKDDDSPSVEYNITDLEIHGPPKLIMNINNSSKNKRKNKDIIIGPRQIDTLREAKQKINELLRNYS